MRNSPTIRRRGTIVGELTAKVRQEESNLESVRVSVDSDLQAAKRGVASAMDLLEIEKDELSALQQPTADKVEEAENKVENARTDLESAQQKADNDIERAAPGPGHSSRRCSFGGS